MSKRHDAIFDDVLKDMDADAPRKEDDRAGARFLKRSNALADAGEREEKVLRWVDPSECVMWERHNRDYAALTAESCSDLIDGIKSQGQQEFPAIVRSKGNKFEVICGARRHFAISWLQANNYPQFKYLIEVRDLTDEEAFRLADIENRDREDLSDYERAVDYSKALDSYYGGKQKMMAERMQVSEVWLSRYLQLARMPFAIVDAYPDRSEIKESHVRQLRPVLKAGGQAILEEAQEIADHQAKAREGQGELIPTVDVLKRLKQFGKEKPVLKKKTSFVFRSGAGKMHAEVKEKEVTLSFARDMNRDDAAQCFRDFQSWYASRKL